MIDCLLEKKNQNTENKMKYVWPGRRCRRLEDQVLLSLVVVVVIVFFSLIWLFLLLNGGWHHFLLAFLFLLLSKTILNSRFVTKSKISIQNKIATQQQLSSGINLKQKMNFHKNVPRRNRPRNLLPPQRRQNGQSREARAFGSLKKSQTRTVGKKRRGQMRRKRGRGGGGAFRFVSIGGPQAHRAGQCMRPMPPFRMPLLPFLFWEIDVFCFRHFKKFCSCFVDGRG